MTAGAAAGVRPEILAVIAAVTALGVLVVAYVAIALDAAQLLPWNVVVHEDGRRTLLQTVFYFEHAARELPPDLLLGICIGGAVLFACPPARSPGAARALSRWALLLGSAGTAVMLLILAGALLEVGVGGLLDNLLQKHSRPGAALSWGAHWRYHLGSRLALMLTVLGIAALLRSFGMPAGAGDAGAGRRLAVASLLIYLGVTLVFAGSPAALATAFLDPVSLGHQARELLTHGSVTVPVAGGACLLLACRFGRPRSAQRPPARGERLWLLAGAAGLLLGTAIVVSAWLADSASHGQTAELHRLIFPHYFEHTLSYLVVALTACLSYAAAGRPAVGR